MSSISKEDISFFLKDVRLLSKLPQSKSVVPYRLAEFPFDGSLLSLSKLYLKSRKHYLKLGGKFIPRISSVGRSLSAQDLFKSEIDYTPIESEILWFKENYHEISEPETEVASILCFNTSSVFHEQNHRIIWPLLPPPAKGSENLAHYLNFAESLVVMLDLALADEIGPKLSPAFERMKVIYRTGNSKWKNESKSIYRNYLLATMIATYMILEWVHPDDILPAMDYVLPRQKNINRDAHKRSLDINELFTRITNPEWQKRNLKDAGKKLASIHSKSKSKPLQLPKSVLDLDTELDIAERVLDYFQL